VALFMGDVELAHAAAKQFVTALPGAAIRDATG
jgi:hypothetical protein